MSQPTQVKKTIMKDDDVLVYSTELTITTAVTCIYVNVSQSISLRVRHQSEWRRQRMRKQPTSYSLPRTIGSECNKE